jgi:SulP family sulfate permease
MSFLPPDLQPKLLTVLREGYSARDLGRDLLAGVVVGIIALPLAIAFAIASGVRPEQGIYTAIVAGLVVSLFGGSRVQIGGPTGAFVVIVAGIVAEFGYQGLAMATAMAGILLIVMAWARLGDVIRFIPYPVTVGFTSGIALIIAVGQLGDGLGLDLDRMPADFWGRCRVYFEHAGSVDAASVALFVVTIAVIRLWPRVTSRLPGPLAALLLTTVAARLMIPDVATVGSRFGAVPSTLPSFRGLAVDWEMIPHLVSPALTIALLAAIESLLSALVADGLTGGRHRSNAELMAQGIANLVTPLFGGIPATGAIARTATNVKNGGRTPVAGIAHALTLVVILLVAGRWAAWIPLPTLAGILLVVAYNMSEWHVFLRLLRGPRSDVLVLLTTFLLTVAVDLTVAIQAGVVLAALLFMRRMADVTSVRRFRDILEDETDDSAPGPDLDLPPEVDLFEIHGSFCFGAARKFTETLLTSRGRPQVVILRMRHVLAIDATGLQALEDVAARLRSQGATLLLAGLHAQPLMAMERSGALDRLGTDHLFGTLADAVAHARSLVATS